MSECNGIRKQVTDTVCICQLALWIYLDIAKGIDLDTLFECTIGTSFKVYLQNLVLIIESDVWLGRLQNGPCEIGSSKV